MNEQRDRAREARKDVSGWSTDRHRRWPRWPPTEFTGYADAGAGGLVSWPSCATASCADSVEEGQQATIILQQDLLLRRERRPGGRHRRHRQRRECLCAFRTRKKDHEGHFMHIGVVQKGSFNSGDAVTARVDELRRAPHHVATTRSATCCRLALRRGAGRPTSIRPVPTDDEHRCRFDFSHFSAHDQGGDPAGAGQGQPR